MKGRSLSYMRGYPSRSRLKAPISDDIASLCEHHQAENLIFQGFVLLITRSIEEPVFADYTIALAPKFESLTNPLIVRISRRHHAVYSSRFEQPWCDRDPYGHDHVSH